MISPNKIGPYLLMNTIGHGGFSTIRLAFHKEVNRFFACKIISKRIEGKISPCLSKKV